MRWHTCLFWWCICLMWWVVGRFWYEASTCNTLQITATHCNTLQHTATHCNTLQHTATQLNTQQSHATHSAALFGYEGPVHVSFNTLPPISAPKKNKWMQGCMQMCQFGQKKMNALWVCAICLWGVCLGARGWVWLVKKWVGMCVWMWHVTWMSSCHRQMSHVICEWVMSYMNESCHI